MTNKAKTYLKNIQGADTEKKLIGIEIAFKQDMTLSCSDLGSLCRAAEDRRYSLRNNEETLKLKQILFFRTQAEMDAYHDMSRKPEDWTRSWSMSMRLGRKPTPTPNSTQKVHAPKRGCASYPMCFI